MTLQNVLDYINALRGAPDSLSGDDEILAIDLVYLSSLEVKKMLNFAFDLERKPITATGGTTENMDSDFDDILGNVEVGTTPYTLVGTEQINHLGSADRYCYLTYDKTAGLWVLNFNPSLTAGDAIVFTQKVTDSKVITVTDTMPYPQDICEYVIYDVASRLEWQDDEPERGEELKQRRELLLKDLKKKYQFFGNRNNRFAQFDENLGKGFGSI